MLQEVKIKEQEQLKRSENGMSMIPVPPPATAQALSAYREQKRAGSCGVNVPMSQGPTLGAAELSPEGTQTVPKGIWRICVVSNLNKARNRLGVFTAEGEGTGDERRSIPK